MTYNMSRKRGSNTVRMPTANPNGLFCIQVKAASQLWLMEEQRHKWQGPTFSVPRPVTAARISGIIFYPADEFDEDSLLQKYLALADQALNQKKPLDRRPI